MRTIENMVNPFASDVNRPHSSMSQRAESVESNIDDTVISAYRLYPADDKTTIRSGELPAMTPMQIDNLLQMIITKHPEDVVERRMTGVYMSLLLEKSHRLLGTCEFYLTTGQYTIPLMPSCLLAVKPVTLDVYGNLGTSDGGDFHNEHITLNIHGDADSKLGAWAKNSYHNVKGNVGTHCGWCCSNSFFTVYGNALGDIGWFARESTFTIYGNPGVNPIYAAENCFFKTPNEEIYERLRKEVEVGKNNRIQIIDPMGNLVKEAVR